MCICWEKCIPIVFIIIPFANRVISVAAHKCTKVHLDFKWMVPAGKGNSPPRLNFIPWKCIQSCKPRFSSRTETSRTLVMRLQCACNIAKVMHLIIILLSQITKHINQKLTGAGTYGISEKHKLLGSHLCLACLGARRGHWVPLTSEPGSCEFRQTFWDAAVPALSACHIQVMCAVFLAPTWDVDYCCLLYYSVPLWVLVTCHVQGSRFGAAVSFELI